MKQVFQIEIDCPAIEEYNFSSFEDSVLKGVFLDGMKDFFKPKVMEGLTLSIVEQNHGTPENINQKALSLLKRASDSLEEYHLEIMGRFGDSLATEIEEYIERKH